MYLVATKSSVGTEDQVEMPPPTLLRLRGATAAMVERVAALPHRVVVLEEVKLGAAKKSALETRVAALRLATEHDGFAIDMFVPQILNLNPQDVSLESSAKWFAFEYDRGTTRTHGLERFGLPEISVKDSGFSQPMVDAIIVGLAHRSISLWPENDPVTISSVTLSDISRGYGQPADYAQERITRVNVEYRRPYLWVTIIDDPATTMFV